MFSALNHRIHLLIRDTAKTFLVFSKHVADGTGGIEGALGEGKDYLRLAGAEEILSLLQFGMLNRA